MTTRTDIYLVTIEIGCMHTQEASSVPVRIGGPSGRGRLASGLSCLEGASAGLLVVVKGGGSVGVSVSPT